MKRSIPINLVVVLTTVFLNGCAGDGKKSPTQKEAARAQWNVARATVLGSMAEEQYKNGNLADSRKSVNDAMKLDPTNVHMRVLSARLLIESGELEVAARELAGAQKLDEKNAEIDYLNGLIQQRWQQPKMALQSYEAASRKNPSELAYVLARAETLVALERTDDAVRLLQDQSATFEHSAVLRDAMGQLLVQQRKYSQAVDVLRQASILATGEPKIREHLALALYYDKQYAQAQDALTRATREEPFASRPDLLSARGECELALDRLPEARATFERVTQLRAGDAKAWLNLAKVAMGQADVARADASLRRAVALDPQSAETQLMLGYVRLRQGRLTDAMAAFDRAATLDPGDSTGVVMSGYVMHLSGRDDDAMRQYGRALKIKPDDELAAKLLAGADFAE